MSVTRRVAELVSAVSVAYTWGTDLTLRIKHGTGVFSLFGDLALTYLILPESLERCRLVVKIVARYPRGVQGAFMRWGLPWGDLVMMRRQLLNFRRLAESVS